MVIWMVEEGKAQGQCDVGLEMVCDREEISIASIFLACPTHWLGACDRMYQKTFQDDLVT